MSKSKYHLTNDEVVRIAREFYSLAVIDGKSADLTMYGEIVESQPTDWWGDPIEGQFIILSDFLNDLDKIKGCSDLTIHINSVGGDAFASIAIHNRLRELAKDGMNITCIVDGVAMSGGSLIMSAADTVKVNPSSIVMIHDCWTYVWSMADSSELLKLVEGLDAVNVAQAEIYARKTGKSIEEIRKLMTDTTYLSGRKAVETGFADELIEDAEDADVEVSADHRTLYVHGRKMRIAAMGQLPEGIKTHEETVETEPDDSVDGQTETNTDGGDNNTPDASGKKGGNPMTFEDFLRENPEEAERALAEARASVSHEEAVAAAVAAERQRCAEIDALIGVFGAETIQAAKYGNPCTAQEMAFRAAQEMASRGRTFMNQLQADYQESGADGVSSAPAAEEEKPMTAEDRKAAGAAMAKKLSGNN